MSETVAPVAGLAPALGTAIEQSRLEARREVLDLLLDLRDRLKRGEEAAGQAAQAQRLHDTPAGRALLAVLSMPIS